ncbi:MAG TPA: Crp/Fnr family transcriptional regulator [Patescibacteria group bacterium]|nr:Crp/Fnr family transcriptional regulator [Patescibacteria group bacterium]
MPNFVQAKLISFFSQYQKQTFNKAEILIYPRTVPQGVFYLRKGEVRMYAINKNGNELTINIFKPHSFFPMNWVVNDFRDDYIYEATVDAEVFIGPKDKFLAFLHQEPDIIFDLLQRIYKGLGGYFLRMESLLTGDAYFKTVVAICIYARRFGVKNEDASGFTVDVTQKQLAALAGLTRETVTREIKKIADKKLVAYQGKTLIVLDINRLEKEIL